MDFKLQFIFFGLKKLNVEGWIIVCFTLLWNKKYSYNNPNGLGRHLWGQNHKANVEELIQCGNKLRKLLQIVPTATHGSPTWRAWGKWLWFRFFFTSIWWASNPFEELHEEAQRKGVKNTQETRKGSLKTRSYYVQTLPLYLDLSSACPKKCVDIPTCQFDSWIFLFSLS